VPAPIDFVRFFTVTGKALLMSSGFIFAGAVALSKNGKAWMIPTVFISSLTIGILISFSISRAFFKALLKRPMEWYMIQKKGNMQFE